jgi:hypothetical protein
VLRTERFATYLVLSAASAIERGLPMARCLVCRSWFTIRRPARAPRFCSAACRTVHHQQENHHGLDT